MVPQHHVIYRPQYQVLVNQDLSVVLQIYEDDCNGNYTGPPPSGGILVATTDTCWTNGCFYVGCPDVDASNYSAGAHGCVFPPTSVLTM